MFDWSAQSTYDKFVSKICILYSFFTVYSKRHVNLPKTLAQNGYVCRLIRYEITSKLKTHKHSVLRNHLDVPLRYIDHSQSSKRAVSEQNYIIYLSVCLKSKKTYVSCHSACTVLQEVNNKVNDH